MKGSPMASVEWTLLDHAAPNPVQAGDIVSAEAGGLPIYRVLSVAGELAQLASQERASRCELPVRTLRWKAASR